METAPCEKCESEISVEAETCPMCDFEPSSGHKYKIEILNLLGVLFTLSIAGAPIGVICFGLAYLYKREVKGKTPTGNAV